MIEASAPFVESVDEHMLMLLQSREGVIARAAETSIRAGGKRLRPLLVLAGQPRACRRDLNPDEALTRGAVRAAAAVELIHTASLVHDDLLDDAQRRRGVATVGASDGRAVATAAGDLLFSLAFATLVECRSSAPAAAVARSTRILARASRMLAEGEAMQARQQHDASISEAAYLLRCSAKTGALFAAALQLGAVLAGADEHDVAQLGRFGDAVGVAFQVADDVLDCGCASDEVGLGKLPGADVRDGTITLPVLLAIEADPQIAAMVSREREIGDDQAVLERIRAAGGVDAARDRAHVMSEAAVRILEPLEGRFDDDLLVKVAIHAVHRLT